MKLYVACLLILLVALQGQLWFGHGGLTDLWRLTQKVQRQQREQVDLQKRNAILTAEVLDLKLGLAAIEERARSELGMIRNNEIFYQRLP